MKKCQLNKEWPSWVGRLGTDHIFPSDNLETAARQMWKSNWNIYFPTHQDWETTLYNAKDVQGIRLEADDCGITKR